MAHLRTFAGAALLVNRPTMTDFMNTLAELRTGASDGTLPDGVVRITYVGQDGARAEIEAEVQDGLLFVVCKTSSSGHGPL